MMLDLNQVPHYSETPSDPILFFGGPFSNFARSPMQIASIQDWCETPRHLFGPTAYATGEHFYQACKAKTMDFHLRIGQCASPGLSKDLGRRVELRDGWDEGESIYAMLVALRHKFQPKSRFAQTLLDTGWRFLAEDSPTDEIWGIRTSPVTFQGRNLLGLCLMVVRSELREDEMTGFKLPDYWSPRQEDMDMLIHARVRPWYATWENSWR